MQKCDFNTILEKRLVHENIINHETARTIKELQESQNLNFAESLIESKTLTKEELAAILENIFEIRSVRIEELEIDIEAVRHIPARVAFQYRLIPFRRSGNTLAVAFADITNIEAHNAIKLVTDFEIVPFEARVDAIEHAQFIYYGDPFQGQSENDIHQTINNYSYRNSLIEGSEQFENIGKSLRINKKQTYDTFVMGSENQFSAGLCKAVIDQKADNNYNPLLIWGNAGYGKTHLINAVANYLISYCPLKKFILTDADRFISDLYESQREDKLNLFRFLLGETDFLLIDNCDKLLKYDFAQQELALIINLLRQKGKSVILTSKSQMNLQKEIQPKLKEEFESGVISQITNHSQELMEKVISHYAKPLNLPQDCIELLTKYNCSNPRQAVELIMQLSMLKTSESGIDKSIVEEFCESHKRIEV